MKWGRNCHFGGEESEGEEGEKLEFYTATEETGKRGPHEMMMMTVKCDKVMTPGLGESAEADSIFTLFVYELAKLIQHTTSDLILTCHPDSGNCFSLSLSSFPQNLYHAQNV